MACCSDDESFFPGFTRCSRSTSSVNRLNSACPCGVSVANFAAFAVRSKTCVVVKTLLPELACDPDFIDMLAHEARICAKLSHPNLIEVFDFIEHGGIYLLAMEHVVGQPLNHVLRAARGRGIEIPAWFSLRVAWELSSDLSCGLSWGRSANI